MIGLTIWIPIYDQIIVPWLHHLTEKEDGITVLQKIGVGMVLGVVTMVISAVVEQRRGVSALQNPIGIYPNRGVISSLSAMWLVPQLTLIGISEAFTAVGQIELYYKQFPKNVRSIAEAFTFVGMAVSNYLSGFLISMVHRATEGVATGDCLLEDLNKGRLDYCYYLVAGIEALTLGYFIMCAMWYKYKESGDSPTDFC